MTIGIVAEATSRQQCLQHYNGVTVEKRRKVSVGLFPSQGQWFYRPMGALTPISGMVYVGGGKFEDGILTVDFAAEQ